MKRMCVILMVVVLMFSLCACGSQKSDLEKAREEAERSQKAAQQARDNYQDFLKEKAEYDFWQSILGN